MELLSPAGNFEKLTAAIKYGADAVYFGGETFGLRAQAGNFTLEEMEKAIKFLHQQGKKGYLAVNAYARDHESENLAAYLKHTADIGVDAFIISDPGVFYIAKNVAPQVERHISTQANTTNTNAVNFWRDAGASRIILARELSGQELKTIAENSPLPLECFVHGAICISYSGRCLISAYMTGRDANRGECTQPCRWNFRPPSPVSYIQETGRTGQDMEMIEEPDGTYLYNAKDLCLIDRLGEMAAMGISSLKIEGRMKSVMYAAVVTAVYRKALDLALKDPQGYVAKPEWRDLLNSVSNRHYTEGFYAGVPDKEAMNYDTSAYVRTADFLGVVTNTDPLTVECRGKFFPNEPLTFFTPELKSIDFTPNALINTRYEEVANSRAGDILILRGDVIDVPKGSLLRRNLK